MGAGADLLSLPVSAFGNANYPCPLPLSATGNKNMSHTLVNDTTLCRYRYDPLDRIIDYTPYSQDTVQRFYQGNRLSTEVRQGVQHSIFQQGEQLLALHRHHTLGKEHTLLGTDRQRSVLQTLNGPTRGHQAYTPYGHRTAGIGLGSLLSFNGERPAPVTGHFVLGNGYRAFNPVLMRFNSPDSWSPFGDGGMNAYTYCNGDPINRYDPTGHMAWNAILLITNSVLSAGGLISNIAPSPGILRSVNHILGNVKNAKPRFAHFAKAISVPANIVGSLLTVARMSIGSDSPHSDALLIAGSVFSGVGIFAGMSSVAAHTRQRRIDARRLKNAPPPTQAFTIPRVSYLPSAHGSLNNSNRSFHINPYQTDESTLPHYMFKRPTILAKQYHSAAALAPQPVAHSMPERQSIRRQ